MLSFKILACTCTQRLSTSARQEAPPPVRKLRPPQPPLFQGRLSRTPRMPRWLISRKHTRGLRCPRAQADSERAFHPEMGCVTHSPDTAQCPLHGVLFYRLAFVSSPNIPQSCIQKSIF